MARFGLWVGGLVATSAFAFATTSVSSVHAQSANGAKAPATTKPRSCTVINKDFDKAIAARDKKAAKTVFDEFEKTCAKSYKSLVEKSKKTLTALERRQCEDIYREAMIEDHVNEAKWVARVNTLMVEYSTAIYNADAKKPKTCAMQSPGAFEEIKAKQKKAIERLKIQNAKGNAFDRLKTTKMPTTIAEVIEYNKKLQEAAKTYQKELAEDKAASAKSVAESQVTYTRSCSAIITEFKKLKNVEYPRAEAEKDSAEMADIDKQLKKLMVEFEKTPFEKTKVGARSCAQANPKTVKYMIAPHGKAALERESSAETIKNNAELTAEIAKAQEAMSSDYTAWKTNIKQLENEIEELAESVRDCGFEAKVKTGYENHKRQDLIKKCEPAFGPYTTRGAYATQIKACMDKVRGEANRDRAKVAGRLSELHDRFAGKTRCKANKVYRYVKGGIKCLSDMDHPDCQRTIKAALDKIAPVGGKTRTFRLPVGINLNIKVVRVKGMAAYSGEIQRTGPWEGRFLLERELEGGVGANIKMVSVDARAHHKESYLFEFKNKAETMEVVAFAGNYVLDQFCGAVAILPGISKDDCVNFVRARFGKKERDPKWLDKFKSLTETSTEVGGGLSVGAGISKVAAIDVSADFSKNLRFSQGWVTKKAQIEIKVSLSSFINKIVKKVVGVVLKPIARSTKTKFGDALANMNTSSEISIRGGGSLEFAQQCEEMTNSLLISKSKEFDSVYDTCAKRTPADIRVDFWMGLDLGVDAKIVLAIKKKGDARFGMGALLTEEFYRDWNDGEWQLHINNEHLCTGGFNPRTFDFTAGDCGEAFKRRSN